MQLVKIWAGAVLFFFSGFASVQAQCLPAGNYTIDATQPPSATNYTSFTDAVAAMACGIQGNVTFTVAYGSGPYNEQVTIPTISGAGLTAKVVFDGQHADSTILAHDGTLAQHATLLLDSASHITIKNLTIINASLGPGFGIQLTNLSDSNIIQNVRISLDENTVNNTAYGIVASASLTSATAEGNNANYLLIDNVTITGGYGGIRIEGSPSTFLKGNRITNCNITKTHNQGIYVDDSDSLIVHGNYIGDVRETPGGDGMLLVDTRGYFEVTSNQVYTNDWALQLTNGNQNNPSSRSLIANNLLHSNGNYGIFLTGNERVDIFHNTAVGNTGIRLASNCNQLDIRNNIFYGVQSYAFDDFVPIASSNAVMIDYNLYYTDGVGDLIRHGGGPSAITYATLADWQVAVPAFNVGSWEGQPQFYGPNNVHVLDTMANNKGDNTVGILVDVDGETRPMLPATQVDIGADEYEPFENNIAIVALLEPQPANCGDSTSEFSVIILNQGTVAQSGFTISLEADGPSGVDALSTVYTGPIAPWTYDTVMVGSLNNYAGGTYNILAWHSLANDEYTPSDTLHTSVFLIANIGPPTAMGDTACVGDVLELTADTTGYIGMEWYSDAALTNNIGSGDVFFTPTLSSTQTYYVQAQQGLIERTGRPEPGTSPTPTYFMSVSPGWGMEFEVARTVSIDSVTMYPQDTGSFKVVIYKADATGAVYTSPRFYIANNSGNPIQYYLGATLPRGTYIMGITDTVGNLAFLRDPTGAGGPFVSPSGYVTVVGGKTSYLVTANPNPYYWFYDWVVRIPSCYSPVVPVVAFVSDSVADAGNDTAICLGETATLSAGNGTAWSWSTTDVTRTTQVSPTNTTTYSLSITDANGCPGQPAQVTVTVDPLPIVSAGSPATICDGDTAQLSASGADTYVWSNGPMISDIEVTDAGSYIVTGTDANGCVNMDTVSVTVNPLPVVNFNLADTLCHDEPAVVLTATPAGGQFLGQGVIDSLFDFSLLSLPGNFTVQYRYTDANQCTSTASEEVAVVICQGIGKIAGIESIQVYPNPFEKVINIRFEAAIVGSATISVYDLMGKRIFGQEIKVEQNSNNFVIEIGGVLTSGAYIVELKQGSGSYRQQLLHIN